MKNKGLVLYGLFVAAISYLSEKRDNSKQELNHLMEGLLKLSNQSNNQDELLQELDQVSNRVDLEQMLDYIPVLNDAINKHLISKNIKQLDFMQGDINSDLEKKLVLELAHDEKGILDDAVQHVEEPEILLDDFTLQFDDFTASLSSFAIEEDVNRLDDLLGELSRFNNNDLTSDTKVTDDVIAQIALEVENEQDNAEMDSLVENYLDDMIDEVTRSQLEVQEDIIQDIALAYPHLSKPFIEEYFALKDEIAEDYELNSEAIILHRLIFKDLFKLQAFVDVINDREYYVNVDEQKMVVDTFKKIRVTDGKILSELFSTADVAASLDGRYEGYRVN